MSPHTPAQSVTSQGNYAGAVSRFLAYAIDLAIRWSHRHDVHARPLWIVLDVVAVLVMTVGADLGGQMVYKMGYRVGGPGS